ncbi:MAG: hypothetical protein V7K38_02375 [Nostoc sp.]|uniref:hypothetical protein n=1 Tax=Nostoc sp. TaxID=1180 RepID=UPI002FF9AB42
MFISLCVAPVATTGRTGELLWRIRGKYREDKGLPLWAFGLALMAIGGIGLLCGRLIKAAVSRQREFLAG